MRRVEAHWKAGSEGVAWWVLLHRIRRCLLPRRRLRDANYKTMIPWEAQGPSCLHASVSSREPITEDKIRTGYHIPSTATAGENPSAPRIAYLRQEPGAPDCYGIVVSLRRFRPHL
jgi:hypothetical protein